MLTCTVIFIYVCGLYLKYKMMIYILAYIFIIFDVGHITHIILFVVDSALLMDVDQWSYL